MISIKIENFIIRLVKTIFIPLNWLRDLVFVVIGLSGLLVVLFCVWALDDNT
jgi:hypothetical protein